MIDEGEEFRTFAGKPDRNHHGNVNEGLLGVHGLATEIAGDSSNKSKNSRLRKMHRQVQGAGQYKDDKKLSAFLLMEQAQHQLGLAAGVVHRAKLWFAHIRDNTERLPHHHAYVAVCLVAAYWHERKDTSVVCLRNRTLALHRHPESQSHGARADYGGRAATVARDGALVPVPFPCKVYIVQVAAGAHHAAALAAARAPPDAAAWAWGANAAGAAGRGRPGGPRRAGRPAAAAAGPHGFRRRGRAHTAWLDAGAARGPRGAPLGRPPRRCGGGRAAPRGPPPKERERETRRLPPRTPW